MRKARMNRTFLTSAMAGLLGATVLTPAAFAQSAESLATEGQSCEALRTLYTEQSDVLREEWIEQTRPAVDQGDEAQCQVFYDQALTELAQLDTGAQGSQTGAQTAQVGQQPAQTDTQTAQVGAGTGEEGCEELQSLTVVEVDRLREEWIVEAERIIQAGDAAQCQTLYQQASAELAQLDSGQQVEGGGVATAEIVVVQPDAEVQVTQQPPEVTVTNPQPQVTVNQGQPQVLVRQSPPNVRVQVPQPIITIEQSPPEIIITMPDPEVAVSNPQPQVSVRQAEPTVRVEQPEPQVQIQQAEGSDGQADVQIEQSDEAQVQLQQPQGEAQVEVQQQEPVVQFEQAEPNVTVEQVGEADVQFSQTGEPTVTIQQAGQESQQQAGAEAPQADAEGGLDVENSELTAGEQEAEGEAQPADQ
ncbi:hypothetical protein [Rubellimicrobium roseum]|uniref:Uncharacterized protein n=1 Tax=Rubellimicrobium roseum TaxID=687525 RepID=A0A5C4N7C0_9RHOB|nr:hypothetical protein [Rubellimicrobium roseum]TNC63746.1 hypothetical protein FHG71_19130 [Rubellimicrobium roseum]